MIGSLFTDFRSDRLTLSCMMLENGQKNVWSFRNTNQEVDDLFY